MSTPVTTPESPVQLRAINAPGRGHFEALQLDRTRHDTRIEGTTR
ncbi:hypothetical protein OG589_23820 [Sphaerisporangium sp. NBC_01403]